MAKPHTPARWVGKHISPPEKLLNTGYPDVPDETPGLVGGPTTEAVPGSHSTHARATPAINDGGEALLSGRPRETGGARARPSKDQQDR